jgi:hypothetical protein
MEDVDGRDKPGHDDVDTRYPSPGGFDTLRLGS